MVVAFWAADTSPLTVNGRPAGVAEIPGTISKGVGALLGSTAVVIALGAMIGRVTGDAGAAQRRTRKILGVFGERGVQGPWSSRPC